VLVGTASRWVSPGAFASLCPWSSVCG